MTCTPLEFLILKHCARYGSLTNSQFAFLLSNNPNYVRQKTRAMSFMPAKTALLTVKKYPVSEYGRREHLYSLAPAGADLLRQNGIDVPKRHTPQVELDYWHRKAVIDVDLYLDRTLEETPCRLVQRQHYFEFSGANHINQRNHRALRSVTRCELPQGEYFIPDTVFQLQNTMTKQRMLFTLEYVRGQKRTRTLNQVRRHLTAQQSGALSTKYGRPKQQHFVSVFVLEEAPLLTKLLASLRAERKFRLWQAFFLFTTMKDYLRSPLTCWLRPSEPHYRFDLLTGKRYKNS